VSRTQPTTPTPVAQTPTQPAPTTPAATQNYVEVRELGFKIPVDASMANEITYVIGTKDNLNNFSNQASFSTKTLGVKYKDCAGWPGVHQIEKISGKPTDDKKGVIKQFDGFYLFANYSSQVSCSDSKVLEAEMSLINAINNGLKNAVLTQEIAYVNSEYGFRITLPEAYNDYKVLEEKTDKNTSVNFGIKNWRIDIKTTAKEFAPEYYEPSFSIAVQKADIWDKTPDCAGLLPDATCFSKEYLLGKKDGIVFYVIPSQDRSDVGQKILEDFVFSQKIKQNFQLF
jgi:hypothetical protein